MNISPEEAAAALQEIESSRLAMRRAIQSHRGHLHLWLWGSVWIVMAVGDWIDSDRFGHLNLWVVVAATLGSVAIGRVQCRQIRGPMDRRFLSVAGTLLLFGYGAWPMFFHGFHTAEAAYGYSALLWMQIYMVAGIWFDNCLLWTGLIVSALILAGFLLLPSLFWAFVILAGATLIGTGFYVRYFWR